MNDTTKFLIICMMLIFIIPQVKTLEIVFEKNSTRYNFFSNVLYRRGYNSLLLHCLNKLEIPNIFRGSTLKFLSGAFCLQISSPKIFLNGILLANYEKILFFCLSNNVTNIMISFMVMPISLEPKFILGFSHCGV